MGVELTLMPLWQPSSDLAFDMIGLGKDYELFEAIDGLPKTEIEKPVWGYRALSPDGNSTYGQMETDPYGKRLTTVTSTDLLSLKDKPFIGDFWRVKAAWAYLAQMPADWPIVLYWH